MNIFLIGFMGSGKTTIGKQLAEKLQFSFVDSDAWIEAHTQQSVSTIFQERGEAFFRELERDFVHQLEDKNHVIACGGGLPCFHELIDVLNQKGTVIYLKTTVETLIKRLQHQRSDRPLLSMLSLEELAHDIAKRLEQRESIYTQAQLTVVTDHKSEKEIVIELMNWLT